MKCADDAEAAKAKLKGENFSPDAAKKQGEEWAQRAGSNIDKGVGRLHLQRGTAMHPHCTL